MNGIAVNFTCNSGTIIGGNSLGITVECFKENECNDLIVDCPLNLNNDNNDINGTQCELRCFGENSCNNFQLNIHASSSSSIVCGDLSGNNDDVIGTICSNGTINGTYYFIEAIPPSQHIELLCISQPNSIQPSCLNIS